MLQLRRVYLSWNELDEAARHAVTEISCHKYTEDFQEEVSQGTVL
jgi:hypothetical protein